MLNYILVVSINIKREVKFLFFKIRIRKMKKKKERFLWLRAIFQKEENQEEIEKECEKLENIKLEEGDDFIINNKRDDFIPKVKVKNDIKLKKGISKKKEDKELEI